MKATWDLLVWDDLHFFGGKLVELITDETRLTLYEFVVGFAFPMQL